MVHDQEVGLRSYVNTRIINRGIMIHDLYDLLVLCFSVSKVIMGGLSRVRSHQAKGTTKCVGFESKHYDPYSVVHDTMK